MNSMTEILRNQNLVKIDLELIDELNVFYLEYSRKRGFPDAFCTQISHDVANNLKLDYQEGTFRLDKPNRSGITNPTYAWCTDADKIIIDLTLHQFKPYLNPDVKIFIGGPHIIRPNQPLYKRYSPLNKLH